MGNRLIWDAVGAHLYETGVDQGVLYPLETNGTYPVGVEWNGLTGVTESPEGGDANPKYADNIKYLNLTSAEDWKGTIEAFTYPDEFVPCLGEVAIIPGAVVNMQARKKFGMSYRTKIGNDVDGDAHGFKIHCLYALQVAPSERNYETVNDSPDAITFSWEASSTPVPVTGYKPTASITFDSTKLTTLQWAKLEAVLYGVDADEYDASKTYAVGDFCKKTTSGSSPTVTYYRCKTAITTPAAWDASKWDEITNPGPHLPLPDELITILSA